VKGRELAVLHQSGHHAERGGKAKHARFQVQLLHAKKKEKADLTWKLNSAASAMERGEKEKGAANNINTGRW